METRTYIAIQTFNKNRHETLKKAFDDLNIYYWESAQYYELLIDEDEYEELYNIFLEVSDAKSWDINDVDYCDDNYNYNELIKNKGDNIRLLRAIIFFNYIYNQ